MIETNNSIISIFDKNIDISFSEMHIDISNIDNYIQEKENNFFRIKHDLSNIKLLSKINYDDKIKQNIKNMRLKSVDPDHPCFGFSFDPGFPPLFNEFTKSYTYKFNNQIKINKNFSIPDFDIYDIPPGIKILDYIPVVDTGCDYFDPDKVVFPGIPCALPEIAICKKRLSKKIFGRRINLGTIYYPCGYKQKLKGSIGLDKNDAKSEILYSSPKANFNFNGNLKLYGDISVEISSNIPVSELLYMIKNFDIDTYNKIVNSNTTINSSNDIFDKLYSIGKNIDWYLKFAQFSYDSFNLDFYISICLYSVIINYELYIKNFSISYGDKKFSINELYYEETNYEIMQKGRFLSFELNSDPSISIDFGIGNFKLGDITNTFSETSPQTSTFINGFTILNLIIKMANKEINTIQDNVTGKLGLRKKELITAINILTELLNVSNNIPGLTTLIKSINIDVFVSLKLCLSRDVPVPTLFICGESELKISDFIDIIKEDITNLIVETLSLTNYVKIDLDFIEDKISPLNLPAEIKNQVNNINNKIEYANNLYIGYVENSIAKAFSYLDKIKDEIKLTPTITMCTPFFP